MHTKIYEVESASGNVIVVEAESQYGAMDIARHTLGVNDPIVRLTESHPEILHCFLEHTYEGK